MSTIDRQCDYVGLRQASRISGLCAASLYKLALLREIRCDVRPGHPVRFSREDLSRLAGR